MLSPQTLHDLPNEMVDLVNEVQEEILRSIAKKLVKADYLTPSAEWQLYKAAQLRMSTKEINELLAKYTGKSVREIKRLYTAACKEAISNDAKIYRAYGKDCSSALRSVALSNTLKCRYQKRRRNDKKSLPLYGGFLARYRNASYGQCVA